MALQEDDRLWEHLQGKSREELLGLLEQIMKKQPEIKGLLKLLLELLSVALRILVLCEVTQQAAAGDT